MRPNGQKKDEIVVATRLVAPFVVAGEGGQFSGFSIDLWRAISDELGLKTRFERYDTLPALLEAVKTSKNAAGIAAISITAEREKTLDFSHPMFRSGLSIMVRATDGRIDVSRIIFSKTMLAILGILALVILIPAHIFWVIARGRDEVCRSASPIFRAFSTPCSGAPSPWAALRKGTRAWCFRAS